jgi:hypothetical protein
MTLLVLLLAASPNVAQLDAQEALNDVLEARFNGLCSELKSRGGLTSSAFANPPELVQPQELRWVKTCSFRALSLTGPAKAKTARILRELDGLTASGERLTERGEANATLTLQKTGWAFTRFEHDVHQFVRRPRARFTDVANEVGLTFSTPRTGHLLLGGLAVRDVTGDGRLDVLATNGTEVVLFTQSAERFAFTPTVVSAGHPRMWTSSVSAADFDDDGDAHLLVTHHPGPVELFENVEGRFTLRGTVGAPGEWH